MGSHETNKKRHRPQRGFSLVELLVSMAVVGVLAGISIPMTREIYRVVRITMLRVHFNILVQFGESVINDYEAGVNPLGAVDGTSSWCHINGGTGGGPCSAVFDTAPVMNPRYRGGIQWVPYRGYSASMLYMNSTRVEMYFTLLDCKLGYSLRGGTSWGVGSFVRAPEIDYGYVMC